MAWDLFGRKKKAAEKKAKLQAKAALPPIMAPGETGTADPAKMPPRSGSAARDAGLSEERIDALTVLAAIESAKQELAQREKTFARNAKARVDAGRADPNEDPAQAIARKKQLIQAAMTVHKLKQPALKDLSRQDRDRLRGMAESALGVGRKPPGTR